MGSDGHTIRKAGVPGSRLERVRGNEELAIRAQARFMGMRKRFKKVHNRLLEGSSLINGWVMSGIMDGVLALKGRKSADDDNKVMDVSFFLCLLHYSKFPSVKHVLASL